MRSLALMLPGAIDQLTGGYLYARHLVQGLRSRGIAVAVHELRGAFPVADATASAACEAALAALPDGAVAVIDGLALAGFDTCLARESRRLSILALVHHPLAAETGLDDDDARRFAALETRLLPFAAGVICPSARTAASVAAYGVASDRIEVAPPGTARPVPAPPRAARSGAVQLLSVATVTPRKGHRVLIAALARIADRDWQLTIIGSRMRDPAEDAAVARAIAQHGFGERVTLTGERRHEHLAAAYDAADIFVLASFHEGYGMALAEALAYGLPVVATTAGAIPNTVPQSAGLLVPPGNAPALAAALARVIDDNGLRARLAAGARTAGAALPDWDAAAQRWLDGARRLVA